MTKLKWENADQYEQDPGAVVSVPDTTGAWTPPEERRRKAIERTQERRDRHVRSELHDFGLLREGLQTKIRRREDLGLPLSDWEKRTLYGRCQSR